MFVLIDQTADYFGFLYGSIDYHPSFAIGAIRRSIWEIYLGLQISNIGLTLRARSCLRQLVEVHDL